MAGVGRRMRRNLSRWQARGRLGSVPIAAVGQSRGAIDCPADDLPAEACRGLQMPAPTLACECAGPRCWDALREGIAANGRHGVWWCFFSDFSKGSFPHTHHVGEFRRAPPKLGREKCADSRNPRNPRRELHTHLLPGLDQRPDRVRCLEPLKATYIVVCPCDTFPVRALHAGSGVTRRAGQLQDAKTPHRTI